MTNAPTDVPVSSTGDDARPVLLMHMSICAEDLTPALEHDTTGGAFVPISCDSVGAVDFEGAVVPPVFPPPAEG